MRKVISCMSDAGFSGRFFWVVLEPVSLNSVAAIIVESSVLEGMVIAN
jgi:hypothetical protein